MSRAGESTQQLLSSFTEKTQERIRKFKRLRSELLKDLGCLAIHKEGYLKQGWYGPALLTWVNQLNLYRQRTQVKNPITV